MIFDYMGLPKDTGATDWLDSCRLAGMMAITKHSDAPKMTSYLILDQGVRHPSSNPNNFTRDQLIPLMAGLCSQNKIKEAEGLYGAALFRHCRAQNTHTLDGKEKPWYSGADILTPLHMLVMAKAARKTNYIWEVLGRLNAVVDVFYNAAFTPERESNQLICCLYVLGPRWLSFYRLITPKWENSVINYWTGWRGEPELAEKIIRLVKEA